MGESPKTIDTLRRVATLKRVKGWSFTEITRQVNKHLPIERQLKEPNGVRQIERWLSPHRATWVEPRSEIILAFLEVLKTS